MELDQVLKSTILLSVAGSQAHGTAVADSDTDQIGVALEDVEHAIGLVDKFEQWVGKGPEGDITIYSLNKFCRLALGGNPTILEILHTDQSLVRIMDARGSRLRDMRESFASKRAVTAFLGYMKQQVLKLTGERGQKDVNRKELVEQHGYDTKYAAHIIRLGYEGLEYAQTGKFALPLPEHQCQRILAIRRGEVDLPTMLAEASELTTAIKDAETSSVLPDKPDTEAVNRFMVDMYMRTWDTRWQRERTKIDEKIRN